MSKNLLLILMFVLAAGVTYFLSPYVIGRLVRRWKRSADDIAVHVDCLFFENAKKRAHQLKVLCVIVFVVIGLLLPAAFSGLNRVVIDSVMLLNKQGNYAQAIALLVGMRQDVSPLMHNELGVAYFGLNDLDQAEDNLNKAIKMLPGFAQAHANLATLYEQTDRHSDATFEWKRAKEYARLEIDDDLIYGKDTTSTAELIVRFIVLSLFLYLGLKFPHWLMLYLRGRRNDKFDDQLPDALSMMSNTLKAGTSLAQSIELSTRFAENPVKQEFGLLLKEYRLGRSMTDCFVSLRERMPTEDTRILVSTVCLLFETGGDLPSAMESIATTVRQRKKIRQKIAAMTADGKAQAVMLSLVPVMIGVLLNTFQKETFSLMYTTLIGWSIMALLSVWWALGVYSMWKIVQIKI